MAVQSIKYIYIIFVSYIVFLYLYIIYYTNMKSISLNVNEIIFSETEQIVSLMKKSRNRYINEAIDFYNKHQRRMMLEQKLQKESGIVKEDSLNILKDFEDMDYGD